MADLTAERLREVLDYCAETGLFTWRRRISIRVTVGRTAGTLGKHGYFQIGIDGTRYLAHRLAFLYMTGAWPEQYVDHIDGVKTNNRWTNLRDVSNAANGQNQHAAPRGVVPLRGVTPKGERFGAQITVNYVNISLGRFDTPEEAHAAYIAAKRRLHPGNML